MKKNHRLFLILVLLLVSSILYFWTDLIDFRTFFTSLIGSIILIPNKIFGFRNYDKEIETLRNSHKETRMEYQRFTEETGVKYDSIEEKMRSLEEKAVHIKREIDSLEDGHIKTPYEDNQIRRYLNEI